jgi:hypothetical protein
MSHFYSSNCVQAVYSINDGRNLIVRSQTCVRVREVPRLRRSHGRPGRAALYALSRAKPRHAQVVRVQLAGLCGVKPTVILPKRDRI